MKEEYGIELDLDLSKLNKQVSKAKSMAKDVESTFRNIKITGLDEVKEIKFDTSGVEEVKDKLEEVADVKKRIENGDIKITGIEPLSETLSDAEYNANRLKRSLENTGKFQTDFSYLNLEELEDNFEKVEEKAEETKGKIGSAMQQIKEYLKNMSPETKAKLKFLAIAGAVGLITNKLKQTKKKSDDLKNSMKELGERTTNALKKGIASLKRFALSLFGIQSAYRALTKAIHSYLAYDEQLSKSIQNTWVGLGSFFAPVLEYLVGLFQKLLAYVNALVKAFTGIDFVARANAKALDKMGASAGSTAKAMKQLGSFDELNNINTDTGGGSGGGGADVSPIELPEVNAEAIDKLKEKIEMVVGKAKQILGELFQPLQQAWETSGTPLVNSMYTAFANLGILIGNVGKSFMEVWTNGTGQVYVETILGLWTSIFNTIGNIAKAITIAWNNAGNGTKIIQNILDIVINIAKFALDIAKTIEEWTLTEEFQEMMNTLIWMLERISYYVSKITEDVENFYKNDIKPVLENALGLISDLIALIGSIWKTAEPVLTPIINMFKSNFVNSIKVVMDRINAFIDILRGLAKFATGVLQGDWEKAMNGLKQTAKGAINYIISGLNILISGINKIASPLRLIILGIAKATGKNVSFDNIKIPSIPKLKIGTDEVLSEGIAYLHAGEKVVPADVVKGGYSGSDNEETNELLRQLITLIDEKDFEPYIRVDDIGSASVNYINKKKRITGEAIV